MQGEKNEMAEGLKGRGRKPREVTKSAWDGYQLVGG